MSFELMFSEIRSACEEAEWSKAVELSRRAVFVLHSDAPDEKVILVSTEDRAAAARVTLWIDACDWSCEGNTTATGIVTAAAAAIAFKHGKINKAESPGFGANGLISYDLSPTPDAKGLELQRFISEKSGRKRLPGSLSNYVGGIKAGRIQGTLPVVTQGDYAVDRLLDRYRSGAIPGELANKLVRELKEVSSITYRGTPISVSNADTPMKIQVVFQSGAYLLSLLNVDLFPLSSFYIESNTLFFLTASKSAVLKLLFFHGNTHLVPNDSITKFHSEVLPLLKKDFILLGDNISMPNIIQEEPYLLFETARGDGSLLVQCKIVYGKPAIAEVTNGELLCFSRELIPARNIESEKRLANEALRTYSMPIGRSTIFYDTEIPEFFKRTGGQERTGEMIELPIAGTLTPVIKGQEGSLSVKFRIGDSKEEISYDIVESAFSRGDGFVPLGNGLFGQIPKEWFQLHGQRAEEILKACEQGKASAKANNTRIADFVHETKGEMPAVLDQLRNQLRGLNDLPELDLPKDLNVQLRDYQLIGARWLQTLRDWELGALLADDMGLGKTLQALTVIRGQALVIAPTSVMHTWAEQAKLYRPGLNVRLYWGQSRCLDTQEELVITSYGVLRQDWRILSERVWDMVIVDESQTIKNPDSLTAQAVFSLNARFRIAATGTPVENSLRDLWSQFHFILPGFLPDKKDIEVVNTDSRRLSALQSDIRPYILRRTKEEVAKELPSKTEEIVYCELTKEERDIYQAINVAMRKNLFENADLLPKPSITFALLEALLRLRQACCHTALVPGSGLHISSKLDTLEAMLQTAITEGHRALVFSQWTSLLDLLEVRLDQINIKYLRLDGSTVNRQEIVQQYQSPDGPPVLMMSLKAGGVGLTLTAADYVFFCDPWWNPAAERQAEDRAHRIGQDKPVFVYRLVAKDTIEERVLDLQRQKKDLASNILEVEDISKVLSKEELLKLIG